MTGTIAINACQVATLLGRSLGWFRQHRASLEAEKGFPKPIDGCGLRWSDTAVRAWIGRADKVAPPAAADEAELIARARALAPA